MSGSRKFVYFAQHPLSALVKIGFSTCPAARMKQLSSIHKAPIELLAAAEAPEGYADERRLHEMFDDERVEGEWFSPSERILAAIDHVRETGKIPQPEGELREDAIMRRRCLGHTYRAIAIDLCLSHQRVRQIDRKNMRRRAIASAIAEAAYNGNSDVTMFAISVAV